LDDKNKPFDFAALLGLKPEPETGSLWTLLSPPKASAPAKSLTPLYKSPLVTPAAQPSQAIGSNVSVVSSTGLLRLLLARKRPFINQGRVLPKLDDLSIGEGRKLNAAFLYNDLSGFSKLVATLPTSTSFSLMQAFLELMSRVTTYFSGTVVDCAGDRVLSVFHRGAADFSFDPAREAITAALWMQVIVQRVIAPAFAEKGVQNTSVAIGVDYGAVTIGCVGIRNNKRLVFFGDGESSCQASG
jgi:hypothetical protein